MDEEPTQNLSETRSFEERVFMRFDAVDSRLERLESRSYDTKPIWERALKEIHGTRIELGEVKAGLAGVKTDVAGLKNEFSHAKRDVRRQVTKRLDPIQVFQFEYREDIRDDYERIEK